MILVFMIMSTEVGAVFMGLREQKKVHLLYQTREKYKRKDYLMPPSCFHKCKVDEVYYLSKIEEILVGGDPFRRRPFLSLDMQAIPERS